MQKNITQMQKKISFKLNECKNRQYKKDISNELRTSRLWQRKNLLFYKYVLKPVFYSTQEAGADGDSSTTTPNGGNGTGGTINLNMLGKRNEKAVLARIWSSFDTK